MRPLLLAVLLAACACGPGERAPDPMPSAAAAIPGAPSAGPVRNFAKVDEGLWRGAQPDEAGFRALREMGVKTIVNLRYIHSDTDEPVPEGVDVVEIPIHALLDSDPPTDEDLRAFFDVVLDPARRPVYVHCAHGKDRTGTMCAVYRMEVQGWTPEQAFEEMQEFGFHDMYVDLAKYVKSYVPRGFGKSR